MNKPHIHAEFIKAWADGAEIEFKIRNEHGEESWWPVGDNVSWHKQFQYRIKPKADIVVSYLVTPLYVFMVNSNGSHNLELTFDSETDKLKSAKVL